MSEFDTNNVPKEAAGAAEVAVEVSDMAEAAEHAEIIEEAEETIVAAALDTCELGEELVEDMTESDEGSEMDDALEGSDGDSEPEEEPEEELEEDEELAEIEVQPEKKRHRWTWVTTLIVVVAAILVLAMIGFLGYKEGWLDNLKPKAKASCEIGDYSKIEVMQSEVEITEEMVDNFVSTLMSDYPDEEFNDAWVQKFAADVLKNDIKTTDEFREYCRDYMHDFMLHSAMMTYMRSITEVKSYDEAIMEDLMEYSSEGVTYYAAQYGVDPETLVQHSGFESLEAYTRNEAENYSKSIMMLDKLMKEKKLTYTAEEVDDAMLIYMHINGMGTIYTLEEFKELSGETWVYLFENIQFKSGLVMSALEDNVVYLQDAPE